MIWFIVIGCNFYYHTLLYITLWYNYSNLYYSITQITLQINIKIFLQAQTTGLKKYLSLRGNSIPQRRKVPLPLAIFVKKCRTFVPSALIPADRPEEILNLCGYSFNKSRQLGIFNEDFLGLFLSLIVIVTVVGENSHGSSSRSSSDQLLSWCRSVSCILTTQYFSSEQCCYRQGEEVQTLTDIKCRRLVCTLWQ